MKKNTLNYRFYNPNTAEVTADILLKVLIEVNAEKVERAIREDSEWLSENSECDVDLQN